MKATRVGMMGAVAGALAASATTAHAQLPPNITLDVGLYVQVEAQHSSLGTEADGRTLIDLNRARPRFTMTVDDWITARLEPDFAGSRARIRYAYVEFAFDEAAVLRAGQYKKPFGLIQRTSSSLIPVIQRPTRILGLQDRVDRLTEPVELPDGETLLGDQQTILDAMGFQGYAAGVTLEGVAGAFEYEAGVFEGPAGSSGDGQSGVSARAAYALFPGFKLGAAVSHNRIRFDGEEEDGTAGALELAWNEPGVPGFGVLGEVVRGSGVGTGTDFAGGHFIGWLHRGIGGRVSGIEPHVRVSWGDPDTDAEDDAGTLLTAGFNVYFGGRNRLMLNWDVYAAQNGDVGTESTLRAQAQVRF